MNNKNMCLTLKRLEKYQSDLKEIRLNITPHQYNYLSKLTAEREILETIEALLCVKYNESLDWLYSTFNEVAQKVLITKPFCKY